MASIVLELDELFARSIHVGGSDAYVGAFDMVVVSRPFTAGEDAVMAWVVTQDDAVATDIAALPDGRDMILLTRLHTTQSLDDAVAEQILHLRASLLARV